MFPSEGLQLRRARPRQWETKRRSHMGYASKGLARPQIAILRTVSNAGLTVAPAIQAAATKKLRRYFCAP